MRGGLFGEIVRMSWETVRGNKMRSFDENFKNSI